ncbi:MAG: sulfite exporter TauE/SafE family protein [Elusimicrobiota bacterium]|nr:MAG: sulfite exporter TauE/SafE family protein [Elusimicrobiota bacterium]
MTLLALGVLVVAFLYACVGHAGASGYIAVMTLCGVVPAELKPAALVLNILVATVGTIQFCRAGHFSWRLFWPFAVVSAPFAFLGGLLSLPAAALKAALGVVLLFSAARFLWNPGEKPGAAPPPVPAALGAGAALGLLSGLTGTGGGIFLTPLALIMGWGATKTVAGVSAAFILVNSISGLAGLLGSGGGVPSFVWPLAGAALVGGAIGSHLGSRRLAPAAIRRLLSAVLVIAGLKLILA